MKLIFISGPSGSGKTTLSNQIIKINKNGIVLSTDNYYKTGLISKLLSKFVEGFFDRSISFNNELFKKDFDFVLVFAGFAAFFSFFKGVSGVTALLNKIDLSLLRNLEIIAIYK